MSKAILWLNELDREDIDLVGRQAADLGELSKIGLKIPRGFVVTNEALQNWLSTSGLEEKIKQNLRNLDWDNPQLVSEFSILIKEAVLKTPLEKAFQASLEAASRKIQKSSKFISVQTSPVKDQDTSTSEATVLNNPSPVKILASLRQAWALLFSAESLRGSRTLPKGAVIIQESISPTTSGLAYSIDPDSGDKKQVFIRAVWGASEILSVDSKVGDTYLVDKTNSKIYVSKIGQQNLQIIKLAGKDKELPVSSPFQFQQKITAAEIENLAVQVKKVENHFLRPVQITWAQDEENIFILSVKVFETPTPLASVRGNLLTLSLPLLSSGSTGYKGLASGPLRSLASLKNLHRVRGGEVVTIKTLTKNLLPTIRKSAAVIIESSRQPQNQALLEKLAKPAVFVGDKTALKERQIVTVDGGSGKVFSGAPNVGSSKVIDTLRKTLLTRSANEKTATGVFASFSEPSLATEIGQKNIDGVFFKPNESKTTLDIASVFANQPFIFRLKYSSESFSTTLESLKSARAVGKNIWLALSGAKTPQELLEAKKAITSVGLHRSESFKILLSIEVPAQVIAIEKFLEAGIDGVCIDEAALTKTLFGSDQQTVLTRLADTSPLIRSFEQTVEAAKNAKVKIFFVARAGYSDQGLIEKLVDLGITALVVNADETERTREIVALAERRTVRNKS